MSVSDVISIIGIAVSCIAALISGLYAVISSTKKFELAEAYKKDLFSWYCEVMSVISKLETQPQEESAQLLASFSTLIDIGRFYFPNDIDREPRIGRNKTRIQWGYRQLTLDFLVIIYRIAFNGSMDKERELVQFLKNEYSSAIFQVIAPEERIRYIEKHTAYNSLPKKAIEDYLLEKDISGNIISAVGKYYR